MNTKVTKEYLDKIRPCLKDIINDLKIFDTWKIQLAIRIFFSSEDDEERVMYSKRDNINKYNWKGINCPSVKDD